MAGFREYELMNKDACVASFRLDEATSDISGFRCPDAKMLPIGFRDMLSFLQARKAPSNRAHIRDILAACGCLTTQGYLDVIHALGLNDTFWVRSKGSALSWESVSLYANPFSEAIARIAFEGGLFGQRLSTPSPEPSMGGSFAKCVLRVGGELVVLKTRQPDAVGGRWEPWSEVMAYQLARALDFDAVPYTLRFHRSSASGDILPATTCPLFTNEQVGFSPASAWMGRSTASYGSLLAAYESIGAGDAFRDMVVLDALTLNVDRHLGNHGVLFDNDTLEVLGMAPIFDNNLAFAPGAALLEFDADFRNLRETLRPRIGDDFNAVADAALTPRTKKKVHELGDFTFDRSLLPKMPEDRIRFLEKIVQLQARALSGPGSNGGFNLARELSQEDLSWQLESWPDEPDILMPPPLDNDCPEPQAGDDRER